MKEVEGSPQILIGYLAWACTLISGWFLSFFLSFLFVYFWWYWDLNSGTCACSASVLSLEPCPSPSALVIFSARVFRFCQGLRSSCLYLPHGWNYRCVPLGLVLGFRVVFNCPIFYVWTKLGGM
jgi:hypothetical protein